MKFKSYSSNELHQTTVVSSLTGKKKKEYCKECTNWQNFRLCKDEVSTFIYTKSFYHFNTTKNTITPYTVRNFFFAENKNK